MLDLSNDLVNGVAPRLHVEFQDNTQEEIKKLNDRKNEKIETAPIHSRDFVHKRVMTMQKELEVERKK